MLPARLLKAVLLALVLVGWAGFAAAAALGPAGPGVAAERDFVAAERVQDCADVPGHHDRSGPDQPGLGGQDHHDHGGTTSAHQGCCVTACGASGPALADGHGAAFPRPPRGVVAAGDDAMRERAVSPLRRPPKPGA